MEATQETMLKKNKKTPPTHNQLLTSTWPTKDQLKPAAMFQNIPNKKGF